MPKLLQLGDIPGDSAPEDVSRSLSNVYKSAWPLKQVEVDEEEEEEEEEEDEIEDQDGVVDGGEGEGTREDLPRQLEASQSPRKKTVRDRAPTITSPTTLEGVRA